MTNLAHAPARDATSDRVTSGPALPHPAGPLSAAVVTVLGSDEVDGSALADVTVDGAEAYGRDLQLSLYICYELHYRGFIGVSDEWEWNPDLLRFRASLEHIFRTALRHDIGDVGADSVVAEMDSLSIELIDGSGRRTSCATPPPGTRCASTSPSGRSITSKRPTPTPGPSRG